LLFLGRRKAYTEVAESTEFAENRGEEGKRESQDPGKKSNVGHPTEKNGVEKPRSTVRNDCATAT
jgi:hypothetical protein